MKTPLPRAAGVLFALFLSVSSLRATILVSQPYRGITLIHRSETSPRPENMNIVEIDLTDPGIQFKLSPATPPSPNTFGSETSVQQTLAYMNQQQAQMAVNISYFDNPPQSNGGTNITGIAASEGNVFSAFDPAPVLNYAILPNAPAINIDIHNHATIAQRGATDTSLMDSSNNPVAAYNTFSGSAQIITNGANSIPVGLPPRPGPGNVSFYNDQITARTAAGLSQDGNTLFLFTVDVAGGSQGMTINEMANFMISQYGVYNALNLDGGGSTSLALLDPFSNVGSLVNAQSNGASARAVGASLAIFAVPEPTSFAVVFAVGGFLVLARRRGAIVMVLLFIGSMWAGQARAATIPYVQDFESIGSGGLLTGATLGSVTAGGNAWSVVVDGSGHHLYQNTLTPSGTSAAKGMSSLQFTNLGPASPTNNFEVSTVLSPVSPTSPGSVNYTAGLRFLANSATSTDDSYVADLNVGASGGRMRIVEFTGSSPAVVFPSSSQSAQPLVPNYSVSKSYLLDVLGTYDVSNALTMTFTVTEVGAPANTQSFTVLPVDASPRTGQFFGFYDSFGANGGTMVANFDNLVVAPEPSSVACLFAGMTCLFARRCRRIGLRGR
jgi:exopolysaccharide biosynthesis protein